MSAGQETPSSTPGPRGPQAPRVLRNALVAGVLCVVLHLAGLFAATDRWLVGGTLALLDPPQRGLAPLLLAIDEASLDLLGPLPWPADTWRQVSRSLAHAGIAEAWLTDPLPTVLAPGPASGTAPAVIRLPRLLFQVPTSKGLPYEPPEVDCPVPFAAWDHQVYLPADEDGVVHDISRAAAAGDLYGPSALCEWAGRCPEGRALAHPIRLLRPVGSLPVVSLAALVAGTGVPTEEEAERRLVLVGVTVPWAARLVHVGPSGVLLTWPEAVGHAVASYRSSPTIFRGGPVFESVAILVVLALGLLAGRLERGPWAAALVALLPAGALLVDLGLLLASLAVLPITATVVAAALPPLAAALASRRTAMDFLRRVALLIVQDAFRYAWRTTRIRTREELLFKLAALTRNHTTATRVAYLHAAGGQLAFTGGFGISEEMLHLDAGRGAVARAARQADGAPANGLLAGSGLDGRLVAVRQGRVLVGYWLVAWRTSDPPPDAGTLAGLARWLGRHLELEGIARRSALREWLLDRLESETVAVQDLFNAATEERRRQLQTLHAVDLPLLTADVAGTVLFVNEALVSLMDEAPLGPVHSVRELVFRLAGEAGLQDAMNSLFVAGRPLRLSWQARGRSYQVTVQPVLEGAGAAGPARTLGYVAWFHDFTDSLALEAVRATVVRFASYRVRNALMVIMGYAGVLRSQARDAESERLLGLVGKQAEGVAAAVEELRALSTAGTDEEAAVEVDFAEIARDCVTEVQALARERHLRLRTNVPDVSLPVKVPPTRARAALALLLRQACAAATPGGDVHLMLWEMREASRVRLDWTGGGLDPELLELCEGDWSSDMAQLPPELHVFARAREVFSDLDLSGSPTGGVTVTFFLHRGATVQVPVHDRPG